MSASKPNNNSFKQLQEETEEKYQSPPESIKENLDGSFNLIKMVGQMVELYLPRVFEIFVHLTGGETTEELQSGDKQSSFYDTDDSTNGNAKTDQDQPEANTDGD